MFIPIATVLSVVGFYIGYYLTAVIVLKGVDPAGMNQFYWGTQSLSDLLYVGASTAGMVLTTTFAACFYGLRTSGGPAAVGAAVAKAVVVNLMIISIVGMVLVTLWYGGSFGLPIGG
jgi:phospholipid/cholesterol/gamma-HCH transport system permease protein